MKTIVFLLFGMLAFSALSGSAQAQDTSIGTKVDDATITTKVKAKLVAERPGNLVKVNVDTQDGLVRLRGTVPTLEDKRKAEELARLTAGVRRVANELTVEGHAAAPQPSASPATAFAGRHTMTGEVTHIDATHGRVTVRTREGDLQLHFPASTLETLKRGDRVTVDLGVRKD
jgi:hyperosmotically inducible periplasmic protein